MENVIFHQNDGRVIAGGAIENAQFLGMMSFKTILPPILSQFRPQQIKNAYQQVVSPSSSLLH